jgi:hypothetical protein
MDVELGVDAGEVALDRLLAQEQCRGDVAVGLAGRDLTGDLPLAGAEPS